MIYGMPTLIENKSLEDNLRLCSELGLQFVELNMNLPEYQTEELEKTAYLLEMKERYGIDYTIHLDEKMNVCDFNQAVAQAYRDTVRRAIAVAKVIEAPVLNMHMNHGIYFTLPDQKLELYTIYQDAYQKSFRSFCHMCEEEIGGSGIRITIENTDGFRSYEKQIIEELLQSDVFKLTWDIGHSHAIDNIDEPFLLSHEESLYHFHIHDALGGKNHLALGTGDIDLKERLTMAAKHQCRCVVETKTIHALRESVEWLKKSNWF